MEGTSFEERRAALAACVPVARDLVGRVHQVGSDELGPLFGEIDQLQAVLGALKVAVLDQALTRGDVQASDAASTTGWVRLGALLPRRWRGCAGEGGRGGRQARNALLAEAVLSARVPVAQRRGRVDRDGQAAAAVDPGVRGDGAGRVRGDRGIRRAGARSGRCARG